MMEKAIQGILYSMNVKQDREDAESKALSIYKAGPDAFDTLLRIGLATEKDGSNSTEKRNLLRAVILAISIYFKKDKPEIQKRESYGNAVNFLIDLAVKDFQSAKQLLGDMGYSESDIYQQKLLSFPITDRHEHDKEISLKEAYEEIRLGQFLSGPRGGRKDHYLLGCDKKKRFEIYRVDKKKFVIRSHSTL